MAIRTKESLQKIFQESRERQERKRELEKQRKAALKAQERFRKQKHRQHLAKLEKAAQNAQKQPQIKISRTIAIYNTKYVERFDDDDLFTTREELQEWEKEHWQCINWSKFDQVVNDTKKMLG